MSRDVFVSYSQADHVIAFKLVACLEGEGITCWIAPRDISPAADWAEEIIDAIAGARLMLLVFSGHSNDSPQVRREVERAVHKGLKILPFRIANVTPSKSLEYFLSSQHWMDAFVPPMAEHYSRLSLYLSAQLAVPRAQAQSTASADKAAASSAISSIAAAVPPLAATPSAPAAHGFGVDMRALESALAGYIGPMAKYLTKVAASRASGLDDLIARLAAEIDAPTERRAFEQRCQQLKNGV